MRPTRRRVVGSLCAALAAPALLAGWRRRPGLAFAGPLPAGSAYRRYLNVWSRYLSGAPVDDREALALLEHPQSFAERRETFPEAGAFGVFTSCTPHRDVFFDCLDFGLRWLTAPDNPDPALPPLHDRGQLYSWQWSFWGRAALELYEATGEPRFLDLLVGAAHNVLAARDDRHGIVDGNQKRVVKSWGSVISFGGPPMRGTDITATGLIALPILQLANRLGARGELDEEIAGLALDCAPGFDEYETFYVDLPRFDAGCYRYAFIPQAIDPTNHMNAFGAGLVELYAFTREARHLERARKLLNFYRNSMVTDDDGAISTPYEQDPDFRKRPRSEWFWKMTVSAELPLALARHGLLVKEEEMIGIARTYADVVMARPDGINAMTRRSDRPRIIDFTKPLDSETPEYRSYVPMIAAGLFFVDREPRIGHKLLRYMLHHPQWFANGLFGGGGAALLARAYSLRRGLRL
ncbi:hypothetical protein [Microvirga thermotolerans]|uniref:Uncharacterized protein n=1 Tax=Microvirga thermotolerans TaxID=2651334 RepID=A0A5P9JVQ5_9HYPH|nr:hypothetical protein [Microvirga thermotolerans]QFU15736.1 hypothetical protein GDR74_05605 [Microvirga thermotolerans]